MVKTAQEPAERATEFHMVKTVQEPAERATEFHMVKTAELLVKIPPSQTRDLLNTTFSALST